MSHTSELSVAAVYMLLVWSLGLALIECATQTFPYANAWSYIDVKGLIRRQSLLSIIKLTPLLAFFLAGGPEYS
jgi:hypothetical protein